MLSKYLYAFWPRNACETCWAARIAIAHGIIGVALGFGVAHVR